MIAAPATTAIPALPASPSGTDTLSMNPPVSEFLSLSIDSSTSCPMRSWTVLLLVMSVPCAWAVILTSPFFWNGTPA